jgi:hypothetical protein
MDLEPRAAAACHVLLPKKMCDARCASGGGTRRRPGEIRGSPSGGSLLGNGTVLCKKDAAIEREDAARRPLTRADMAAELDSILRQEQEAMYRRSQPRRR